MAERLFAEFGFAATTIRQIADRLGAFTASIYNHFETKESILDGVISRLLLREVDIFRLITQLDLPADVMLYKLIYEDTLSVALRGLAPQQLFMLPEVRNMPFPMVRSTMSEIIEAYGRQIERGIEGGLLVRSDPHLTAEYFFSLTATKTLSLDPVSLGDPQTHARGVADFGIRAILAKPERLAAVRADAMRLPLFYPMALARARGSLVPSA